jgi:hypothetical protein
MIPIILLWCLSIGVLIGCNTKHRVPVSHMIIAPFLVAVIIPAKIIIHTKELFK